MLIFRQLFDPQSSTYSYLLADARAREAVLIDPVFEQARRDAALIAELDLKLVATIETHVHADHVTAAWLLKRQFGSAIALSAASGAEGEAAEHEPRVDDAHRGKCHRGAEHGRGAPAGERERGGSHDDGAGHHQRQRRIPRARKIEKALNLGRIDHARHDEPGAEDKSCDEGAQCIHGCAQVPMTCRTTNTVATPAAMNESVATIDRGDRREIPHTPWPLVQPAP